MRLLSLMHVNTWRAGCAAMALALGLVHGVEAGHLGVSPVLLDVPAAESVSGVRVKNGDIAHSVTVQARVFRWQQDDTGNVYVPTNDVVASPPVAQIQPGAEHLIRVVRIAKDPPRQEESYRLLIDELPDERPQQDGDGGAGGAIQMLVRHALPLFFAASGQPSAQVEWQIEAHPQGGYRVHAHNTGGKHVRFADLSLHNANGELIAQRPGLAGYALAQSKINFLIPALKPETAPAKAVRLSVKSETGTLDTGLLSVETR